MKWLPSEPRSNRARNHLAADFLTPRQRLREVLLGSLQTAPSVWPGPDGLTMEDALSSDLQAARAREALGVAPASLRWPFHPLPGPARPDPP
jgi:hypothetical protein